MNTFSWVLNAILSLLIFILISANVKITNDRDEFARRVQAHDIPEALEACKERYEGQSTKQRWDIAVAEFRKVPGNELYETPTVLPLMAAALEKLRAQSPGLPPEYELNWARSYVKSQLAGIDPEYRASPIPTYPTYPTYSNNYSSTTPVFYGGSSRGGCGSRGGPGYRKANGKCASWRN